MALTNGTGHHLPLCIAHRGASGSEPENTLRSFARALELGAHGIELDVYKVENELLVFHDDRLDRTTNGSGPIEGQPLDYLRSLDAGKGERIPFLSEVLELVAGRVLINIELKGENTVAPVGTLIQKYLVDQRFSLDTILVSSFDSRRLEDFSRTCPDVPLGLLTEKMTTRDILLATDMGCRSIHPGQKFLKPELVSAARQKGLVVFAYTVNNQQDLETMLRIGVDGVFTDYPEMVLSILLSGDMPRNINRNIA